MSIHPARVIASVLLIAGSAFVSVMALAIVIAKLLVIAGMAPGTKEEGPSICRAESHAAFDNDSFTLNSVLWRILGKRPKRKFDPRDLQY